MPAPTFFLRFCSGLLGQARLPSEVSEFLGINIYPVGPVALQIRVSTLKFFVDDAVYSNCDQSKMVDNFYLLLRYTCVQNANIL
mmetsp:Transcript_44894/g.78113  ORF Transcript_44894/g.78113 Transcript_44894/m.78113 type:complete len:84 (-) Transcript_44894:14-265(-)